MAERELILVELKEGTSCRMAKPALRVFLAHGGVTRFKRSDGWVVVGKDQLETRRMIALIMALNAEKLYRAS